MRVDFPELEVLNARARRERAEAIRQRRALVDQHQALAPHHAEAAPHRRGRLERLRSDLDAEPSRGVEQLVEEALGIHRTRR